MAGLFETPSSYKRKIGGRAKELICIPQVSNFYTASHD